MAEGESNSSPYFYLLLRPPKYIPKIFTNNMNQDAKRTNPASLMVKPESEDRKPSSAPPLARKVVIKSADMFGDMQKEAVDIAIAVSASLSPSFQSLPNQSIHR